MRRRFLLVAFVFASVPFVITTTAHAQCGTPIVNTSSESVGIVRDGDQVFAIFRTYFSGDSDLGAQKLTLSGDPQWGPSGAPLVRPGFDYFPRVAPDGLGGLFFVWEDYNEEVTGEIFGARFDANGSVLWDGNLSNLMASWSSSPAIASDGANGFFVVWIDRPFSGGLPPNVYSSRRNAVGGQVWTPSHRILCNTTGGQGEPDVISDGAGGAFAIWLDSRNTGAGSGTDIYAARITAFGGAPWGSNGQPVCTASGHQSWAQIAPDGAGGFYVAWIDPRSGYDALYVQRMSGDGTPVWDVDGIVMTAPAAGHRIATDPDGGLLLVWIHGNYDIYAQRLDADGTKLWGPIGIPLSEAPDIQQGPRVASDLAGGGYFVWLDNRATLGGVYAQHLDASGSATWDVGGARLCDSGRADIVSDGLGGAALALTKTSRDLRYVRLTDTDPTGIGDAPAASADRLTANVPNPFRGTTEFKFYADRATPITAEVFDVAGRRVATQELQAPRAGWQPIVVTDRHSDGTELASGVYFFRVRAGETVATRKMVIMR